MKNLVMLHMESLSNAILKMNEDCFPNLNKWGKNFEFYRNYYSTATSTNMVITDLFFGNMAQFEKADYLENIFEINCQAESIFNFLSKKGYYTRNFYYGYNYSEVQLAKKLNQIIAPNSECWVGDQESVFEEELSRSFKVNLPFAVFVGDDVSHINYKGERLDREIYSVTNWFKERYKKIDATLGIIFDLLVENNLINKTIVLIYGDHGEEYWFHGLYEGYTHAMEPFTHITSCPLMVFDGLKARKDNLELTATTDISQIIKEKLGFSEHKDRERKYVFSRNLFAAQTKRADIFHKSYSVTNGEYTLIVTKCGVSLYLNRLDPFSFMNLLNFYKFKHNQLMYQKKYDYMISSHYKNFMNAEEKNIIIEIFEELSFQISKFLQEQPYLIGRFPLRKIAYNKINKNVYWLKYGKWKNIVKSILKK